MCTFKLQNINDLTGKQENSVELTAVHFSDDGHGWTAGSGGQVFRTINAGARWEKVSQGSTPRIHGLQFLDHSTGWIVGVNGILRTVDGGCNWEAARGVNSESERARSSSLGYGQGSNLLARIQAGGLGDAAGVLFGSGIHPAEFLRGSFYKVRFADRLHGCAVGGGGAVASTVDGGATWTERTLDRDITLRDVYFWDARNGWIVGDRQRIYRTIDGGATWAAQAIENSTNAALSVFMTDRHLGWAVGWNGLMLRTIDGGNHWKQQGPPLTSAHLTTIRFRDSSHGWVTGAGGTVLHTDDGGVSWSEQRFEIKGIFNDLFVPKGPHPAWAVGSNGVVLRIDPC